MTAEPISSVRSGAGRAVSTLARQAAGAGASPARLLALAVLLAAATAAAEEPARRALTPPDPTAPTPVYLDLYGLEIYTIDEREQTFQIGARLSVSWRDERLAFDADEVGAETLIYQGQAAEDKLASDVWWPSLEIVDSRGPRERMQLELRIDHDGEVFYDERFTAFITQDFYLADFPFDQHRIEFSIEPYTYDARAVVFVASDEGRNPVSWEPTEWYLENPELTIDDGTRFACSASGTSCAGAEECPEGETCEESVGFSAATLSLSIRRDSSHYLWKILLPLVLIIVVSSAVYWMDLERFPDPGDRFGVAFTAVLTVVAFDFVTSDSLPKLWYTTLMDEVLILAYVFATFNVAGIALTTFLSKKRPAAAERAVSLLRWLFGPTFAAAVLVLVLIARS